MFGLFRDDYVFNHVWMISVIENVQSSHMSLGSYIHQVLQNRYILFVRCCLQKANGSPDSEPILPMDGCPPSMLLDLRDSKNSVIRKEKEKEKSFH